MNDNPLSKVPLFSILPRQELDAILSALETKFLKPNEVLFREGDLGEYFYVVASGTIEVLLGEGKGRDAEMMLNLVQEGEYLGEMSLVLPGGHRTATARARDEVTLLAMSRPQFLDLTQKHPQLSSAMVNVLSQRLDAANTQSFRDLTEKNRQLQTAYDELKAAQAQLIEKERLERELQLAADIQLSILPDELPDTEKADFGARIVPARQVGGDFYDIFLLDANRIGVVIGDVADKGVPSAIFMARAHALIMAEADASRSPGEVMRAVNNHITRLQKSTQFVTVLYGVLDFNERMFRYARAGHEPPLLLRADGTVERLQHGPGMALGLWEDIALDEREIVLPEGSTLLLFTDGMTDCRDPKGEAFGIKRITQKLSELTKNNAQQTCDFMLETLKSFQNGAKQDDDVTLVAIHLLNAQSTIRLRKPKM